MKTYNFEQYLILQLNSSIIELKYICTDSKYCLNLEELKTFFFNIGVKFYVVLPFKPWKYIRISSYCRISLEQIRVYKLSLWKYQWTGGIRVLHIHISSLLLFNKHTNFFTCSHTHKLKYYSIIRLLCNNLTIKIIKIVWCRLDPIIFKIILYMISMI